MDMNINFPNLHIYLDYIGKYIDVFGFKVAYYGVIMAVAILAGILIIHLEAKWTEQDAEDYFYLTLITIIISIIGARVYYVIFSWNLYKNDILSIFNFRQGGLAIYGGIIFAIITIYIYSKKKNLYFPQLLDTACLGLIVGQIIGRWGNFFNREAFGGYTNNIFAMQIPVSAVRNKEITKELIHHILEKDGISYIQVHPTFLYELLWNIVVLFVLLILRKKIKFHGEVFLVYMIGYSVGRFWIEGLRTDQLLIPIGDIPVSQVLACILVMISTAIMMILRKKYSRHN